jgi:hypothetical protein
VDEHVQNAEGEALLAEREEENGETVCSDVVEGESKERGGPLFIVPTQNKRTDRPERQEGRLESQDEEDRPPDVDPGQRVRGEGLKDEAGPKT